MWDKLALAFDREFPPKDPFDGLAWDAFKESDHPRGQPENKGEFGPGGGGGKAKAKPEAAPKAGHQPTKTEGGKRVTESGGALPAHIAALKIPPGWTDVTYNPDPNAALLVVGKDAKGRRQPLYSDKFSAEQAAAKFARINELNDKIVEITDQNQEARLSKDPKKKAAGDCTKLIISMGIRPGSEDDTGAEKQAFGATTLQGQHVVVEGGKVTLKFVGKKGVSLSLPVDDPDTAAMLRARKRAAGDDGQLFGINEKALLDHVHTLGGGGFKTKDFRTLLGTRTATAEVAKRPAPTTLKEYKKAVMDVAKVVSTKLGNTPIMALQAYINPTVFSDWKILE